MFRLFLLPIVLQLTACVAGNDYGTSQNNGTFEATSSDGVRIFGYPYFGDLPETVPTILLFHQGGASARGEFAEIADWLNGQGYRAIAWDLRKGGDLFGIPNQTVAELPREAEAEFCVAYRDVEAALSYSLSKLGIDSAFVLGSSYSGSLVYQLAAKNPQSIRGVISFSPASGGPVAECKADMWAQNIAVPALVIRPLSEMERQASQDQRDLLVRYGATFMIADPGTHGASSLLSERAGGDVSKTRETMIEWLSKNSNTRNK